MRENFSQIGVISMSDRKALELSFNGISPFKRGEGSTPSSTLRRTIARSNQ